MESESESESERRRRVRELRRAPGVVVGGVIVLGDVDVDDIAGALWRWVRKV